MDPKTLVDYAASLDCIHCGLCLSSCPTYRLTGRESSSPRGRVFLMRAVAEERLPADDAYAEELDFCLVCRGCESACPAGVRFGEMMEHARDALGTARERPRLARLARWLGFRVILPHRRALRLAVSALRIAQRTGLVRLARWFGPRARAAVDLPAVPPAAERRPLPAHAPAHGDSQALVTFLEGCVMPELYGRVNRASVERLNEAGFDVRQPRQRPTCCGALHAHNGELEQARALAIRTIQAFGELRDGDLRNVRVVTNSAGCGAHLKAYGELLRDDPVWSWRAKAFAQSVVDLSELLARHPPSEPRAVASTVRQPIAWDDPCHLCHGQGVRAEPRAVLDAIVGLERIELPDSEACCGSAGIYSVLRPADSAAVFEAKIAALRACGAKTIVTSNPGCQLQWEVGLRRAGLDVDVVHLAELGGAPSARSAPAAPRSSSPRPPAPSGRGS